MSVTQLPTTVAGVRQILTYSRVSGDRLLGIYGQEEEILAWADENGYEVVGHARDNQTRGIAPPDDRDGLTGALNALQGPIRGIAVSHLDRLARDVNVMLTIVQRIWAAGRDLFTVDLGLIPRGRKGLAICRRAAELAAYELVTIQRRLQSARRRKTAHGGYAGGHRMRRRYGMELVQVEGRFEYRPIPHEQAVLRRIAQECGDGVGYRQLARTLNAEGVPTTTGVPWSATVVRDLARRGPDGLRLLAPPVPNVSVLLTPSAERRAGA